MAKAPRWLQQKWFPLSGTTGCTFCALTNNFLHMPELRLKRIFEVKSNAKIRKTWTNSYLQTPVAVRPLTFRRIVLCLLGFSSYS